MERFSLKWYVALGMGALYFVLVFAACFVGFIHPVCWAFFPVLAAVLGSGPFYFLAARWKGFGVGTYLALWVCVLTYFSGEATTVLQQTFFLGGGVLSDVVRSCVGSGNKKSLYAAYPFLALGTIGWIIRLWTEPQWYYDGAVSEMGVEYADRLIPLSNPWYLVILIVLTAAAAVCGVWLCGKVDKKSAALL